MLTAHHLSKSYNLNSVLRDISFSLSPSERVGLIGPNGCGKTTLLRILAGLDAPDQGLVTYTPPGLRIGYLSQGFELPLQHTVGEILQNLTGNPQKVEREVERLASSLALEPERPDLQEAYNEALQRLQMLDPASEGRIQSILAGLGLSALDADSLASTLSGGQKTRLALGLVLLHNPQLLLLDEPTNHLDIGMLEWLESWLVSFPGSALIVSHDRTFLDHTVNRILDLNPETGGLQEYPGNYTSYLTQYRAERQRRMEDYQDQVYEIRRMKQDIARTKQQALHVEMTTTSRQPGVRRYAKKVAQKAKSREKKLERYLQDDERVEKPHESWQMKMDFLSAGFGASPHLGQDVLTLDQLAVGYPGCSPLLTRINLTIRAGKRVAITGPNGGGKTTLLRTIAGMLAPLGGNARLGASVRLGYMTQEQELLDPDRTAAEIIQSIAPLNETEIRSFLHFFLFTGDDPVRPCKELSYGERARLSLAVLVAQGSNFLLLDEPINHLDIPSRARFEQALELFRGTVLAVVHDRYFIERFADEIWMVANGGIKRQV